MFSLRKLSGNCFVGFPRFSTFSVYFGEHRARLKDKVALVTAATDGIGLEIGRRLALDGASVVISSRKKENVDRSVQKLRDEGLDVIGTVCHVAKNEDRNNLVDFTLREKGQIDIFVSNAAVNPAVGRLIDCSEESWDKIFDVNVRAAFLLSKRIIPEMEKTGNGSIVFISTVASYLPVPTIGAYCVSKTTLLGLTKVLAAECSTMNIRVNCVCPGLIKTRFSQILWDNEQLLDVINKRLLIQRIGQPEEVSPLVSFLCSDEARYITGESIPVAGGYYSRL